MSTLKKILISRQQPANLSPYTALTEKYGVEIEFTPFYIIEPLTSREFRAQRVNFLDYTAITFSSRHAIDAFFQLANELRTKIPETMKYFCTTEAVAMYLQKHIVYRKRKIFFGDGSAESLLSQIGPKHEKEKFLITTSASSTSDSFTRLFDERKLDYQTAVVIKSVSQDLKGLDLSAYSAIVLHNVSDVVSLQENFPDFKPEGLDFISYGRSVVKAMEEAGLQPAIQAPAPEVPSVAKAIELYLEQHK